MDTQNHAEREAQKEQDELNDFIARLKELGVKAGVREGTGGSVKLTFSDAAEFEITSCFTDGIVFLRRVKSVRESEQVERLEMIST